MSAIVLSAAERNLNTIVQAIRQLTEGRSNAVGTVTLTAGVTTTTVLFANCSTSSLPQLTAMTANAATALATTFILQANILNGSFIITHANNGQTDRTFAFVVLG